MAWYLGTDNNFPCVTRRTHISKLRAATEVQRVGRRQSSRGWWCSWEIRCSIPVGRAALLSITRSQLHLASPLVIPQDGALLERSSVVIGFEPELITFLRPARCSVWNALSTSCQVLFRICKKKKKSGSGNYIPIWSPLHRCCFLRYPGYYVEFRFITLKCWQNKIRFTLATLLIESRLNNDDLLQLWTAKTWC